METPYHILVVDDQIGIASDTAEILNNAVSSGQLSQPIRASAETSFEKALEMLYRGGIDLLVLDVVDQAGAGSPVDTESSEPKGRSVFEQIRSKRFVPIVFLTALPHEVEDLENPPFIQVVSKRESESLIGCVETWITSQFPPLYRALQVHFDIIARGFMIDFVEKHWVELKDRSHDIAYLLMRRLGVSFDSGSSFLESMSGEPSAVVGKVPPIRYYIVPSPEEYRMGDILKAPTARSSDGPDLSTRYVIMTPTCDLVKERTKADVVVLAECMPLDDFREYTKWAVAGNGSRSKRTDLERLLKSNPRKGQRNRYYYLPHAWTVPDMMVDFQRISHIPYDYLDGYNIEASLDSPYAEALSHQFHCYLGRVGTPDLDLEAAIIRMRP